MRNNDCQFHIAQTICGFEESSARCAIMNISCRVWKLEYHATEPSERAQSGSVDLASWNSRIFGDETIPFILVQIRYSDSFRPPQGFEDRLPSDLKILSLLWNLCNNLYETMMSIISQPLIVFVEAVLTRIQRALRSVSFALVSPNHYFSPMSHILVGKVKVSYIPHTGTCHW